MLRFHELFLACSATLLCVNYASAQYATNLFLNGQYQRGVRTSAAAPQASANVFLDHAISSRQTDDFQAPIYLPPNQYLRCASGQQCVRRNQCQNGYFSQQLPSIQNCVIETDICCTYRAPPPPPAPPAPAAQKPFNICAQDYDCVAPVDCGNGEIIAKNYIKKPTSNQCYAPSVCCRLPSTVLTQDGYVLRIPAKTEFPLTQPQSAIIPTPSYLNPTKPITQYLPPNTPSVQIQNSIPVVYRPAPPQTVFKPSKPAHAIQPLTNYLSPDVSINEIPYESRTEIQKTFPAPAPQPTRVISNVQKPYPQAPPRPQIVPQTYSPVPQPSLVINNVQQQYPQPAQPQRPPPRRGEALLSPAIYRRPTSNVEASQLPTTCASALVCTPENYCNSIGVIVESPVNLSPTEAEFRVPLSDCALPTGGAGKCCRDSNYVDPWPINQEGVCAKKVQNTKPQGIKDIDANFAEVAWQAMIARDSTKTLLCGGTIVGAEFVLTAASCVKDIPVQDVRVKGGEWELGSTNEPLPFQLIGAVSITIHPEYNPTTGAHDLAMIRLERRFNFATNVLPLCVSDEDPSPNEQCITSGWGKAALKIHEQGAIMHRTKTTVLARSDCGADESSICVATQYDACEFDVGSALACGTGINVHLRGIYSAENGCGEGQAVRFTKPDIKWINTAFAVKNKPILQQRL